MRGSKKGVEAHDQSGMRLITAPSWGRPSVRRQGLFFWLLIRTGIIERREYRVDFLSLLGIRIQIFQTTDQGNVFGTQFYLQFKYLPGKCLCFLAFLLLISLADLLCGFVNLAVHLV